LPTADANWENPQELLASLPRKLTSTSQHISSVYQLFCAQQEPPGSLWDCPKVLPAELLSCFAARLARSSVKHPVSRQSDLCSLQRSTPEFLDYPAV